MKENFPELNGINLQSKTLLSSQTIYQKKHMLQAYHSDISENLASRGVLEVSSEKTNHR